MPSPEGKPRVLVAGCGFVGQVAARQLHALGWEVTGVTRHAESARLLSGEPYRVVACDLLDRDGLAPLGPFEAVILCASSGRGGAEAYRRIYLGASAVLLNTFTPQQIVFAGSTSVYAQTEGEVVTETSPTLPDRETGRVLLEAEQLVLGAGGHVVRLGGLYATGRWILLEKFLDGRAVIEGDGSRIINQIHRDDAASALTFMLTGGPDGGAVPPGIYNATDGQPLMQREVYAGFSWHFRRPLPPCAPPDLDRKRGWTNKRVNPGKLLALGWRPRFQHFRDVLLQG